MENTKKVYKTKDIIDLINFKMDDFDILKTLLQFDSVSKKEQKVAIYVKNRLMNANFIIKEDIAGNVYAVRGIADKYLMLNAHLDNVEIRERYESKNTSTTSRYSKSESTNRNRLYDYSMSNYYTKEEEITVSDFEATEIWERNEESILKLFGNDFKEIGFTCSNCINSCKKYKLCYHFSPKKDDLETKMQYAKYHKERLKNFEKNEAYKQETFDIDEMFKVNENVGNSYKQYLANRDKSLSTQVETKKTKKKEKKEREVKKEEKYIVTVDLIEDKITGTGKYRVLGGDDKCGIFLALMIAEEFKDLPMKILFTVEEEIGCVGIKSFAKNHKEWFNDVKYNITIDRRGSNHLLWKQKGKRSCSDKFAAEMMYYGILNGIAIELQDGGSSDVVTIRDYVKDSVNISAAYYNAHTTREYIVPSELDKIYGWLKSVVTNL